MAMTLFRERFSAVRANPRAAAMETASALVHTFEVFGASTLLGVYEGKMGSAKMYVGADDTKPIGESGAPLSLILGGVGTLAAMAFPAKYARHVRGAADGCLAVYGNDLGRQLGHKWASPDPSDPAAKPAPEVIGTHAGSHFFPAMGASATLRASMSPEQLHAIDRIARAHV